MRTLLRAALSTCLALSVLAGAGCEPSPVKQLLAVGSACNADSDCGTAPPFRCDHPTPAGYCRKDCLTDLDCPSAAVCVFTVSATGQCAQRCDRTADCRFSSGYVCLPSSDQAPRATHAFCDVAAMNGGADSGAQADMTTSAKDGG